MERIKQLFKLSKTGAILQFEVIARSVEDGAVLITRKGQLGGLTQEDIEPMYPKNIGRANETSPFGQAEIMFNSKVNKLLDKGYKSVDNWELLGIRDLRDFLGKYEGTDANHLGLPMLAQKDIDKILFPGDLQPKFDGVRCINKGPIWRSRRGKFFEYLTHLTPQVPKLPPKWELDGELYCHGKSLQQIVSMVKREQAANLQIGFRNYDIMGTGLPWRLRKLELRKIHEDTGPQIKAVLTRTVHSMDHLMDTFRKYRMLGYEGAMWRDPNGLYEEGVRSWHLIKVKDFMEEDFEIIDVEEATGRDAGTAIMVLETPDGKEFRARPMGTREYRKWLFENIDEYIYKKGTVRFQNYTDGGIPFHARFITIRDYE